ncbi:NRDE family protein [Marinobacterium litorale]|uniref:NRDE family protein n=1 Tax=Marinobacterium litorale TaxID=404770 RepID=UPI000421DC2E|nr:NRDE family protein [Marinobacterium litorale]
MCLIAIALKTHPKWPLVVLANRDEFYDRPTRHLGFWPDAPLIGGRDLLAGGTWLALSRSGRFSAVTNYREGGRSFPYSRSRGTLPTDFLLGTQPAAQFTPDPRIESGYNLLCADHSGIFYHSNRGGHTQRLGPGIHTLSNGLLESSWPKQRNLQQALEQALGRADTTPESLLELLLDERTAPDSELPATGISLERERLLSRCFIRSPGYGTRARTLILQNNEGETLIEEVQQDALGTTGRASYRLDLPPLGWN